jgi:outer membrane murein-binding lipoprotein Lpp
MMLGLQIAILAGVVLAVCGVVSLHARIEELHTYQRHLNNFQEDLMADFTGFESDMDGLKAAVADAATRVEALVATATDDSADQAQVDAARAALQDEIAALKGIAPDTAPTPAPEPAAEPTA